MLDFLQSLAFRKIDHANLWRGDTGFLHDDETTAADVMRYEQERVCLNALYPQLVGHLAGVSAAALLWVTRTRQQAARYGPPSRVVIDDPHTVFILAEDKRGGLLLYFADDATTSQTEQPTMKPPNEATARDLALAAAWYVANSNQPTPSPDTAKASAWLARSDDAPQEDKDMKEAPHLTELDADRRDALANRIDFLQGAAEGIKREDGTSAAEHYQGHREAFDMRQAELSAQIDKAAPDARPALADEREAQGHEYAGFLDTRLAEYHERGGQDDLADSFRKDAEARTDIAAILRVGNEPERQTERFEPYDWHEGNYVPSERERADMLDTLRSQKPDASIQAVMQEEHDEFSHTPALGPVTEAMEILWHSNIHGEQYPDTFGEAVATLDRVAGMSHGDPEPQPDDLRGGKYDALRDSEAQARDQSSHRQEQELAASKGERAPGDTNFIDHERNAADIDEALKEILKRSSGGADNGPALNAELSQNIRPDMQETPKGTATVTTAKNSDPIPEADLEPRQPTERESAEMMQPIRPEERRALEAATAQHPDSHVSPEEAPDPKAEQLDAIAKNSAAESTTRQEGELAASKGEAPANTAEPPTAKERLAARMDGYRAEREAAGPEAGQDQGFDFDGPALVFGRD